MLTLGAIVDLSTVIGISSGSLRHALHKIMILAMEDLGTHQMESEASRTNDVANRGNL